MGDPWFPGWFDYQPKSTGDKKKIAEELFYTVTNCQNCIKLITLFNQNHIQQVVSLQFNHVVNAEIEDLDAHKKWPVFGQRCIQIAYITKNDIEPKPFSVRPLWKTNNVLPRIKIFIRRFLNNILPISKNLNRRINSIDPIC